MRIETTRRALTTLTVIWWTLATACVFLLGLGTDEAWVLNGLRSVLRPPQADLSSVLAGASGGPFALANLGLEWAAGSRVWAHRLFSLACLGGVAWLVVARGRSLGGRGAGALALAPLLAVPGTAEVGTIALGHSTALFLFVLFASLWTADAPGGKGLGRALACGLLLGLAAASRLELALTFPAVVIASCLSPGRNAPRFRWPRRDLGPLLAAAGLTLAISMYLMIEGTQSGIEREDPEEYWKNKGVGFGLGWLINYPARLNRVFLGMGFAPTVLIAFATLVPFWLAARSRRQEADPARRTSPEFEWLMIVSGWVLGAGWFVSAPIPHLRYLWPSLCCFAIAGGSGLAAAWGTASRRRGPLFALSCHALAVAAVLGGCAGTTRSLVLGDHDTLSWEWTREMGADYFRRFQAVQDQREAADYLRSLPEGGPVPLTYGPPFILRYLADRPVVDINELVQARRDGKPPLLPSPTTLIIPPAVGTYFYLRPEAHQWIAANARLDREFGRWAFYHVDGPWPEEPSILSGARTNYEAHPSASRWFGR